MVAKSKIVSFDELVSIADEARGQHQSIVQCHGVFDLLHIGHIRYLQAARRRGNLLIVTVTPDQFVNKGPHRPVFEAGLRAQAIASLDCVDYVAVNQWPTAVEAMRRLRPAIFAKGAEFRDHKTPEMRLEEAEAASLGVQIDFIEDDITSSSSHLINHFFSPFNPDVDGYLAKIRARWRSDELLAALHPARDLPVVVVGDAILDEYIFCSTLGQSTKSPNVVGRWQAEEHYLGGALAVANHLAGFCREVKLVTLVGSDKEVQDEIRAKLRPAVQPTFIVRELAKTTVRRQFRDAYFSTILFELYLLDDSPLAQPEQQALETALRRSVSAGELIVVADYGYGMLNDAANRILSDEAPFLAVTSPATAANLGYHTISRFPKCDYFALAEHDLRLDRRDRDRDVSSLLIDLTQQLGASKSLLTVGSRGSIGFSPADGVISAPALATRIVDRQGAAEAAFAVSTLAAKLEVPMEQLLFFANISGALAAATMGNSQFVDELTFRRAVESLLK